MRYLSIRLLYILCVSCIFHATDAMAGEVWVVKPKPVSVWVVQKPSKQSKVCACSTECVCGCNAGKECNCNQLSGNSGYLPMTNYSNCTTGNCGSR